MLHRFPFLEVVPNPKENNSIYRPSRPLCGPHERYLPSNREGRRGRAHAATMAEQGPPLDLSDKGMDRPPARACQEANAANIKDAEPKVVRLPTGVELDEGYIFGRDHCAKVSMSTIQPPEGPLTNHQFLNIIHAWRCTRFLYPRRTVAPLP